MLNKAMHKTRCKCMRKEEEKRRSIHGDNTNVLVKEFKPFTIKRFGEQISLQIINVNELKSKSTIFDKLRKEVMSNLKKLRDEYIYIYTHVFIYIYIYIYITIKLYLL